MADDLDKLIRMEIKHITPDSLSQLILAGE
jgi:hypothetical protein